MQYNEALTRQFYAWERHCRGWNLYSIPVDLEPTFEPFCFHSTQPLPQPIIDDGLRPTLFTSFVKAVKSAFAPEERKPTPASIEPDLEPYPFTEDAELVALSVSLSKDRKIRMDKTEQLLLMLSLSQYPISFEIIATFNSIRLQFVCREPDAANVQNNIKAFFPDSAINESDPDDIIAEMEGLSIDFGLGRGIHAASGNMQEL